MFTVSKKNFYLLSIKIFFLIQLKLFPFVRKIKNIFARGHKIFFVYVVKIYRSVYFKKTPKKGFSGLSRAPYRAILFSFSNKNSKTTKTIAVREDCAGMKPRINIIHILSDAILYHLSVLLISIYAWFHLGISFLEPPWRGKKFFARSNARSNFPLPGSPGDNPIFWGPHTPV